MAITGRGATMRITRMHVLRNDLARRDFLRLMGKAGLASAAVWGGVVGVKFHPAEAEAETLPGPLRLATILSIYAREKDLKPFQDKHNVKIELTAWTSNTDQANKLAAEGFRQFDLSTLGNALVEPLMKRGILAPIDTGRIPNYRHVYDAFKMPAWGSMGGKLHAMSYHWGYDSIVYNADFVKEEVVSWKALFDDKYAGRIALRDDPQFSIAGTAYALGYKNPYKLSSEDLKKIKAFLISKKPLIRKLWTGYSEAVNLIRTKEVWIELGWPSMWLDLLGEGMNVKYAWTLNEGTLNWIQTYVMSPHTKIPETCYAFLNWVLGKEYGASVTKDIGEFSSSRLALEGLTQAELKRFGLDKVDDMLRTFVPTQFVGNIQEWNDTWSEFKAA